MEQPLLAQPTRPYTSENLGQRWQDAMRVGDFEAAWRVSDCVLAARPAAERDDPNAPYHLRWVWDGREFDGRSVLVRCYHGLGDTLQFSRYLAPLRRRVTHLTLEVQPELIPLLNGPDDIVAFDPARPLPPSDCDFEIMELAHALRIRPEPAPYLPIPRTPRFGPLRVGVCWKANAAWQPHRSLPDPPVKAISGVAWHSLQHGEALPGGAPPCPADIADTARLIASLDLVISVDTMVAHLAGAIGIPLFLLLPAEPDWRWLAQPCPWYADVRTYQQIQPGEWGAPVAALLADLTRESAAGTLRRAEGL